ncbi:hypothetical protein QCA50_019843 [Cerrena zonata]|uniref:Uncharacterized protein n=1 Tax=Cerrena zonata TaxID=2478898 RepID=A0AAW0FEC2_9APHY
MECRHCVVPRQPIRRIVQSDSPTGQLFLPAIDGFGVRIPISIPDIMLTLRRCKALLYLQYIVDILSLFVIAAFACLRTWAISEREILPLATVFVTSMFVPCINIYNYSLPQDYVPITSGPLMQCNQVRIIHPWRYCGFFTSLPHRSPLYILTRANCYTCHCYRV